MTFIKTGWRSLTLQEDISGHRGTSCLIDHALFLQQSEDFQLEKETELRFEVESKSNVTLEVISAITPLEIDLYFYC